jgi:hypothetical protein
MKEIDFKLRMMAYGDTEEVNSFVRSLTGNPAYCKPGIDFTRHQVETSGITSGIEIWNYSEDVRSYNGGNPPFRGNHAIIILVDVTRDKAFEELGKRILYVDRYANEDAKKCIVPLNLNNPSKKPTINLEDLKEFTDQLNIPCYFEWQSDISTTGKGDKFLTYLAKPVLEGLLGETLEEFESSIREADRKRADANKVLPTDEFKGILRGIEKYTNGVLKQTTMEEKLQEQTNLNGETWTSRTSKKEPQFTKGQILEMLTKSFPKDAADIFAGGLQIAKKNEKEPLDLDTRERRKSGNCVIS